MPRNQLPYESSGSLPSGDRYRVWVGDMRSRNVIKEPLQVYIACPWDQRARAATAAVAFEEAGCGITCRWWEQDINTDIAKAITKQAMTDYDGIISADLFVLLNHPSPSGGIHVETGIALELEIPIIIVGERSNIFHYLGAIEVVETVADAIGLLDDVEAIYKAGV